MKKLRDTGRITALLICLTAFGCAHSNPPPPNPVSQPGDSGTTYGPQSTPPPAPSSSTSRAKYSEFNDIPIPPEMHVRPKDSSVFESGQIKMGYLTMRGRVDSSSLLNYFAAVLPREGWKLRGQFKYGRALLIFDKPDKVCVILTKEETYYTYVEIYVSPVVAGG
jgi:hypothetical protein